MNIVLHSFLPLRAESASDEDEDESVVVPKAAQRHPPAKMVSMEDWLALASKPGGMQTALSHGMPRRSSLGKTLVEITQNTGGSIDHQAKQQLKKRVQQQQQQQQQQSSSAKPSEMDGVDQTRNESPGEEKAEEAPPPPSRQPEVCCCQRPQCTEDVTDSTFVCSHTTQRMSSKCCAPLASQDGDDEELITICVTCYTADHL